MATTYTANAAFPKPAVADLSWGTTLNTALDGIDAQAAIGPLATTLHEIPSTTLNIKVAAGTFVKSDGTLVTYAGTASQAMTTAATNYVYLTDAGALTVNTTGFPVTAHVRLATVVAGATTLTSITDSRLPFRSAGVNLNTVYLALAGGTLADPANIVLGTTTGSQIGTATAQKLAFWGATPGIQPASASQAAVGTLATVALTDSTGGAASTTLAAITDTATKNAVASLAAQEANTITDLTTLKTLVNQIRSDLVARGLLKGSA